MITEGRLLPAFLLCFQTGNNERNQHWKLKMHEAGHCESARLLATQKEAYTLNYSHAPIVLALSILYKKR